METSQNPANHAPGGRDRNKTNKPSQPKVEIRVRHGKRVTNDSCHFSIRINLFFQREPMVGQEVVLEEENSILAQDMTDSEGCVMFNIKENLGDEEQIKTLYIRLSGTPDEKMISLIVPAKTKIKPTIKKFKVKVVSSVDATANSCELTFECSVFEDDQPFAHQPVILKKGAVNIGDGWTDNNGQITFQSTTNLTNTERVATYRICLVGSSDEEDVNVTIPAAEPKKKEDNDPETMILMGHSNGNRNFKVKVRITKAKGVAFANAPFAIWYKGRDYPLTTNNQGEQVFNVPGTFKEGEEQHLAATVSGIEDQAKITLRRKKTMIKTFAEKFCRYAWLLSLTLWFLAILFGPGKPLINSDIFRGNDGLSTSERFYNESAGVKSFGSAVAASSGGTGDWLQKFTWLAASLMTVFAIILTIVVLVRAIVFYTEETMESIFHKSYGKADDPMFEKLAKYVGSYSSVSRKPAAVHVDQVVSAESAVGTVPENTASEPKKEHGHGSLWTFVGLDLLIETILTVLRKTLFK